METATAPPKHSPQATVPIVTAALPNEANIVPRPAAIVASS